MNRIHGQLTTLVQSHSLYVIPWNSPQVALPVEDEAVVESMGSKAMMPQSSLST